MIRLGVSACFMYPDPNRTFFGPKTLAYFEQDMARYLCRKGVMPILLPDLSWDLLTQYLDEMDGFVFQGGSDVSPKSYNEPMIENGRWPGDRHRDEYELRIMDYAFKKGVPILAICRGMQVMNVYFGGTLYQDLKIQHGTSLEHRNAQQYDTIFHDVSCTRGGFLHNLYGKEHFTVNTVHHQGVKDLGKGLVVDAISPDDKIVEAFHYKDMDRHYALGVQWHPEFSPTLKDKVVDPSPILENFLAAVKARKK